MRWDTGIPRGYGIAYDELNRLIAADYADGSSFTSNQNRYNTSYGYDANGNISTLSRYLNATQIDNLTYTYISSGNRLQSVNDATGNANGYDDNNGTYTYDNNRNLGYDPSKGTYLDYNYLNLPEQVQFGANDNLRYTYDAAGNKLVKVVDCTVAGNNTRLDYSGNFVYENDELKAIFTSAGRIIPFDNNGNIVYKFEYSLQDHLGNTRVVFSGHSNGQPEVMQVTNYYPFGMVMNQTNTFADGVLPNKYLYNNKELQDDELAGNKLDWYDYGARFYDPELGRFHSVDPLTEMYSSQSPFVYADNSPVRLIDFMGMGTEGYTIDEEGYIKRVDDTGGDNYDVLYTKMDYEAAKKTGETNEYGNPEPENHLKVSDTSILPSLSKTNTDGISSVEGNTEGYNMLKVFKFSANNSSVEWSLDKFSSSNGTRYTISTEHSPDFSPYHESLGIATPSMISSWHSHPGTERKWERSSMGELKYGITTGKTDWERSIENYNQYGREIYKNNVYFPISGNRYYVSPWKIIKLNK